MFWVIICTVHLTVCSFHVTYPFQSETTLYIATWQEHTVKCTVQISTQNTAQSLGQPIAWVFLYELSGSGFKSSCSHLNFKFRTCFKQGVPSHSGNCFEQAVYWHSGNYKVWIYSERRWHDKDIKSNAWYR